MKIALDWIADYLSPAPAARAAADALMNAGLPVESIQEAAGAQGPTQVLDVEVTSNRTDCLSHLGLARELAALTGGTLKHPAIALHESATPAASLTSVQVEDAAGCPYYSARVIRNLRIGPSPDWLQKRLESLGLRPINNVVDITNYVLMELGQPLHAFDYDKLAEKRIIVRRAAKGEKMQAIDGREYALDPAMLVIADATKPVAIAGVMGGKETEVTEATTSILLESARFEPLTIRTTSRTLALKSDSSYRFERGIDPAMAEIASQRAAQLILQLAGGGGGGGDLAQGVVAVGSTKVQTPVVSMRFKRFRELIGISIAPDRAMGILAGLGFVPSTQENLAGADDDVLSVRIPSHRLDVDREVDLIEEIARVHGYHHVPTLDRVTHAVKPEPTREKAARVLRTAMTEAGFSECVTVTFIPEEQATLFAQAFNGAAIRSQHGGWRGDGLRPSLLPSLLAARRTNQYAGIPEARLFETGAIFVQQGSDPKLAPLERRMLAAVASDLSALAATVRLLANRLHPDARIDVEPVDFPFYIRGAAGEVRLHAPGLARGLGNIGVFTPEIQKKFDLREKAAGMELDYETLIALFQPVREARAVPRFPGIQRDLSIVVEEATRWADIQAALADAQLAFLESIQFVTTFRSAQVGKDKKSLTLTLTFRDPARTLKSEEVDAQVETAIATLQQKFAAVLRT
jgi:phenylalanyl-tRNA synthetase beta chain